MDARLFAAASTGNISDLHQLIDQNPLILHTVSLTSSTNPLHIASINNHVDFAKEVIKLHPEFLQELNPDGFSPLHLASANSHLQLVKEMLKNDVNLCRLKGRDNKTALHIAALKGRVDVIEEMRSCCVSSIEDVTLRGETALYLAVKSRRFEAFEVLLKWVVECRKDEVLNLRDEKGNTILHLATFTKQRQVIETLFDPTKPCTYSTVLEVNAKNKTNLTPLDLLSIFPSEAGDREIADILIKNSATSSILYASQLNTQETSIQTRRQLKNPIEYFKFQRGRDNPSDARNGLLVIAVLVATATYQVGLSPPGGNWQDNSTGNDLAGRSIIGTRSETLFLIFVVFNSIGFSISIYMISALTSKFPLRGELQICLVAVYFTYNVAVIIIAPENSKTFLIGFTSVFPTVVTLVAPFLREGCKSVKGMGKRAFGRA